MSDLKRRLDKLERKAGDNDQAPRVVVNWEPVDEAREPGRGVIVVTWPDDRPE